MRSLLRIAGGLAVAYVLLLSVVYLMREWLTFPIRGGGLGEPEAFDLRDGVRITIPVPRGDTLAGWWLPPEGAAARRSPALIWFHGNGETVQGLAPLLREFRLPGIGLLAVDPRGYGASTGTPTAQNVADDAVAVYDWLAARADVDADRIVVYGRSVGSGPAARVARDRPVAGLVLESAFTSLRAMARAHYPYFPSWLASRAFDNVGAVRSSRAPVLIIQGTRDEIVPPAMARALAEAAAGRASRWMIDGAGHNETFLVGGEEYLTRVAAFVRRAVEPGETATPGAPEAPEVRP